MIMKKKMTKKKYPTKKLKKKKKKMIMKTKIMEMVTYFYQIMQNWKNLKKESQNQKKKLKIWN